MTILRLEINNTQFDEVRVVRELGTKLICDKTLHDILKRVEGGKRLRRRQRLYMNRLHARG